MVVLIVLLRTELFVLDLFLTIDEVTGRFMALFEPL